MTTATIKRHQVALTFRQAVTAPDKPMRWTGHILNDHAIDRFTNEPARGHYTCLLTVGQLSDGTWSAWLTTQGSEPGGRRYRRWHGFADEYAAIDKGQAVALAWAARRFYYECVHYDD